GQPIHESLVQDWVDRAYEPIRQTWRRWLHDAMTRAHNDVVRANHPLASTPELASLFDDLFDGYEVVPACHFEAYRKLLREEPLRAPFYKVPVTRAQLGKLSRLGKLRRSNDVLVADVPYDTRTGLAV